jgi:hypothetical protein
VKELDVGLNAMEALQNIDEYIGKRGGSFVWRLFDQPVLVGRKEGEYAEALLKQHDLWEQAGSFLTVRYHLGANG